MLHTVPACAHAGLCLPAWPNAILCCLSWILRELLLAFGYTRCFVFLFKNTENRMDQYMGCFFYYTCYPKALADVLQLFLGTFS